MILTISWTYTRWTEPLRFKDVVAHELRKGKHNENQRTGGLGLNEPWGTRYITRDGRLFVLRPEDKNINLYLEGGCDGGNRSNEFKYRNTMTFSLSQNLALINEIRSLMQSHPGIEIISGDLRNFDLDLWLKATGIK